MDSQPEYISSVPTEHISNPLAHDHHQYSRSNSRTSDRHQHKPSYNGNNHHQHDDDDNTSLQELIQQGGGEGDDETCLVDVGADEEMVVFNKNHHGKTRFMKLQKHTSNSQQGTSLQGHDYNHSLRSFKSSKHKQKAIREAEEKAKNEASAKQYEMHKYLLYFLDPEVEQRYFDFQYVDNAFIPGKVFSNAWTSVPIMSFLYFTEPWYNNADYTVESFSSLWWIGS